LITGIPELEIRRGRCQLVYELVDGGGEPRVFITLQVGLQVVLRKTLVDLRWEMELNKPHVT
jgi:hypothetical protein